VWRGVGSHGVGNSAWRRRAACRGFQVDPTSGRSAKGARRVTSPPAPWRPHLAGLPDHGAHVHLAQRVHEHLRQMRACGRAGKRAASWGQGRVAGGCDGGQTHAPRIRTPGRRLRLRTTGPLLTRHAPCLTRVPNQPHHPHPAPASPTPPARSSLTCQTSTGRAMRRSRYSSTKKCATSGAAPTWKGGGRGGARGPGWAGLAVCGLF
jgi:hypothetical protein